jgi:hypothetical protein
MAHLLTAVGFLASAIEGIAWLMALGNSYDVGWMRSLAIDVDREPYQLLPADRHRSQLNIEA